MKNDNTLVIINSKYNSEKEIKDFNDKIINFGELIQKGSNNPKEKKYLKFVLLGNNRLYLTTLDIMTLKYEIKQLDVSHLSSLSCIEIEKNNFFILGENSASYYTDLFIDLKHKEFQINLNNCYFNSIKINENLIAIISNNI